MPRWGLKLMAQIFHRIVDADSIDELAGVHAVVGVEEDFELAEGLHQLRAEHLGQQSGARLAVAMLAGERAAKAEHYVGGAGNELAEAAQPLHGAEVEVDAGVDATLSVVTVEGAAEAVIGHQPGDGAQVVAELLGRHGCVFPAFVAIGLAGDKDHGAERGVADLPDAGGFFGRADVGDGAHRPGHAGADEILCLFAVRLRRSIRPVPRAES